ncbi:MAG: hypothetical protein IJX25_03450 [Clostridia bacterium]|nr:hypothetical protein [Clostridia bacterium]
MIKWIIIAGVAVVIIGITILCVFLSRKKRKKNNSKLDENIKKLQAEKEELTAKQQEEEEKKKEEEAFANITLTDDVEDEFADLFVAEQKVPAENKEGIDFNGDDKKRMAEIDNFFFEEPKQNKKSQPSKTRDEEFEEFLNEHSYTRRVVNGDILEQIKNLPPKIKAIVLGNLFNKFDD